MKKRIVVAGCRNYEDFKEASEYIDFCIRRIREKYELIFLSGGCRGTDKLGERYALQNGFKTEIYRADWELYGKRAGPKRNMEMAEKADFIICFWNGKSKGTKSMIEFAKAMKKPLKIKKIKVE